MAKSRENPKRPLSRYRFSKRKSRGNLLFFSNFDAA